MLIERENGVSSSALPQASSRALCRFVGVIPGLLYCLAEGPEVTRVRFWYAGTASKPWSRNRESEKQSQKRVGVSRGNLDEDLVSEREKQTELEFIRNWV